MEPRKEIRLVYIFGTKGNDANSDPALTSANRFRGIAAFVANNNIEKFKRFFVVPEVALQSLELKILIGSINIKHA